MLSVWTVTDGYGGARHTTHIRQSEVLNPRFSLVFITSAFSEATDSLTESQSAQPESGVMNLFQHSFSVCGDLLSFFVNVTSAAVGMATRESTCRLSSVDTTLASRQLRHVTLTYCTRPTCYPLDDFQIFAIGQFSSTLPG
ncbi:hypothetical protein AcV7_001769 [Taiwanofungus camphoratus]|nr:hypothetical protein AcV7_001769 [Antrodia cinnamomea]